MKKVNSNNVLKFKDFKLIQEAEGDDEFDFDLGDEGGEEGGDEGGGEGEVGGEGDMDTPPEEEEEVVHNETPEVLIERTLKQIKKKVEKMFEDVLDAPVDSDSTDIVGINDFKSKVGKKRTEKLSFEEMGMKLRNIKINAYSKTNKGMTIKFDDDNNSYKLYIRIDLSEAIADKGDIEVEPKMIKKAWINFVKTNIEDYSEIDTISRNIEDVWEIGESEDFLLDLKLEIDEDGSVDEEELKIETK